MAKRCLIILERKFHLGNPGLKKFPRDMFLRWFKSYGPSFADSQDAFEKAVLASPAGIQIGKDNPKILGFDEVPYLARGGMGKTIGSREDL